MNDFVSGANMLRDPESNEQAVQLTGYNLDQIALKLAERSPELLSRYYPRIYENIGQYHSPKVFAAYICEGIKGLKALGIHKAPTSYRVMAPALFPLAKHNVPTYFLAQDFLEAIKRTDFKEDIDWVNMKLPFEEGLIVLPRGAVMSGPGGDGEAGFILWSRKTPGNYVPPVVGLPEFQLTHTSFSFLTLFPKTGTWIDSTLSSESRPTLRLNNLFYRQEGDYMPSRVNNPQYDEAMTEEDAPLLEKLGVILFGTLLAMTARPDLVELGKLAKAVPVKRDKPRREFWSPNRIGARYYFKREKAAETGSHASPRMHWRRGHMRNQAFGIGRKEHRVIWIEPKLIGATK